MGAALSHALPLYVETPEPKSFTTSARLTMALYSFTLLWYPLVAGVMLLRWGQLKDKRGRRSKHVLKWMIANLACGTLVSLLVLLSLSPAAALPPQHVGTTEFCSATHRLATFFYIPAMGSNYMLLLSRARATLDPHNKCINDLFNLTRLALIGGIPFLMVIGATLFTGRHAFTTGVCISESSVVVVAVVAASDTCLSILLLVLFAFPVYKELGVLRAVGAAGTEVTYMRNVARQNLRLSLIQIVSTAFFFSLAIALTVVFRPLGDPEFAFLRQVESLGYGIDLYINSVVMLFLSPEWIPEGWTRTRGVFLSAESRGVAPSESCASMRSRLPENALHYVVTSSTEARSDNKDQIFSLYDAEELVTATSAAAATTSRPAE